MRTWSYSIRLRSRTIRPMNSLLSFPPACWMSSSTAALRFGTVTSPGNRPAGSSAVGHGPGHRVEGAGTTPPSGAGRADRTINGICSWGFLGAGVDPIRTAISAAEGVTGGCANIRSLSSLDYCRTPLIVSISFFHDDRSSAGCRRDIGPVEPYSSKVRGLPLNGSRPMRNFDLWKQSCDQPRHRRTISHSDRPMPSRVVHPIRFQPRWRSYASGSPTCGDITGS